MDYITKGWAVGSRGSLAWEWRRTVDPQVPGSNPGRGTTKNSFKILAHVLTKTRQHVLGTHSKGTNFQRL